MMYEELLNFDRNVKYIELKNGNHHLGIERNPIKTLNTIEQFLLKNITN